MSNPLIKCKDNDWGKLYKQVWRQYHIDSFDMDKLAKKQYKKRIKTRELSQFQLGLIFASFIVAGGVIGVYIKFLLL